MFRFIFISLLLLLLFWVGLQLSHDPGYVLISYQQDTLEMPLWFMLAILCCLFIVLHFLIRTVSIFAGFWNVFPRWMKKRRIKKAKENTVSGMLAFRKGKWNLAKKQLAKAADDSVSPMLNYLSAAKSALQLGELEKMEEYLKCAHHANNTDDLAVKFTQVNLYIESGKIETALTILLDIQKDDPKNMYAANLLKEIYLKIGNWSGILKLIPSLRKAKNISENKIKDIEEQAYLNILNSYLRNKRYNEFIKEFYKIPKHFQSKEDFIVMLVNCYVVLNDIFNAEKLLIKALKHEWSNKLMLVYGKIISHDSAKQLKFAESFLRKHSESDALHSSLARICVRNKLWGKARGYFEESLHLCPSIVMYAEFGDLLNIMCEYDLSAQCYKKGMHLATIQ